MIVSHELNVYYIISIVFFILLFGLEKLIYRQIITFIQASLKNQIVITFFYIILKQIFKRSVCRLYILHRAHILCRTGVIIRKAE